MMKPLGRERLNGLKRVVIKGGGLFSPLICRCEVDGEHWIVKDYNGLHPLYNRLVGRRIRNREETVYRRLDGLAGIPRFKGAVDDDAFAVEFIDGTTLSRKLEKERLRRALLGLEGVLAGIHERRVVHLDLKQKRNVLVKPDGTAYVVDFQSALTFGRGTVAGLLLAMLKRRDFAGLLKFKGKYMPDLLSPVEQRKFKIDTFLARLWIFTHIGRLFRRIFKSETRQRGE